MNKKTIRDINVDGKKVLLRCDFNVPLDEEGNITDDKRIVESLNTIKYLIENNAKIILCSHLGRPKGEFNMQFSLAIVAKRLSELLNQEVVLAPDVVGDKVKILTDNMQSKDVILLENVRFYKEEEANDEEFSKQLASLADIYVNDAFGTAHRAHGSTEGVAHFLPAVAGFLIEKEIAIMGKALENPEKPFIAIIGGKKVSDKIGVIENLLDKVDTIIIGGAMAYTFFKAMGEDVGNSICEIDKLDLARTIMDEAQNKGVKLILPIDSGVATEYSPTSEREDVVQIPEGKEGLDIGPKSLELFIKELQNAKTVIWNGPVGAFELRKFAIGTNGIAIALSELDATTIICGGDSAAALEKAGVADKMTHISTGGGASLEFMEGKVLPGIASLLDK